MSKNKDSYPSINTARLGYIYKCASCGTYVKKGALDCYGCSKVFSEADVDEMIRRYNSNSRKNWHHIIVFAAIVFGILALLILLRTGL